MKEKSSTRTEAPAAKRLLTVGIPIDAALNPEPTGVEEYTFQLVSHILKANKQDPRYAFIFYSSCPESRIREIFPDVRMDVTILSSPHQRFWSHRVLPRLIAQKKPDVFLNPSGFLPLYFGRLNVPGVVVIHGMEWHNFPKHYSLAERMYFPLHTKRALKNARGIIAVSSHTKKGIQDFFPQQIPPIAIVPHGVYVPVRIPSKEEKEQKNWHILFVGRKDKRKNLKGMIDALRIVQRVAPDVPFTFSAIGPLGNDGFSRNFPTLKRENTTLEIINRFVSESEKKQHYQKADILLFPSYDEGFGMPILEAQAHGVPVVCSSFLKEIAGSGALYCEPQDSHTIASALLTLMLHPAVYARIRKEAWANAKRFSWDKTAKDTLAFLEILATRESGVP